MNDFLNFWGAIVSAPLLAGALWIWLTPGTVEERRARFALSPIFFLGGLVALAVLAMYAPPARAQGAPPATGTHPDQGTAYAACSAFVDYSLAQLPAQRRNGYCRLRPDTQDRYEARWEQRACGTCTWNVEGTYGEHHFPPAATCQTRSEQTGWLAAAAVCYQGCAYYGFTDGDTTYFSTCNDTDPSPTGVTCGAGSFVVCLPGDFPPPALDTDGDGVPDDDDAFPNDPNESADSDGDGIGDNGDTAPNDPTNGADDGGGNESDNIASGGGTCQAPPDCSGDGIQCNQLFQQWKTRCAVEGNGGEVTGDPGNCNAGYTCTNAPVQCAQLAVQRLHYCSSGGGEGGPGHGSVSGGGSCSTPFVCSGGDPIACAQLQQLHKFRCDIVGEDGQGDDDFGEDYAPDDFIGISDSPSSGDFGINTSGWLGGRSCPAASGSVFSNIEGAAEALCNGTTVLGIYMLILGWIHVAHILGRAVSGGG